MEINSLYEKNLLGDSTPEAMINTLWLNNSVHFGLRGVTEHYELRWGDITLNTASDGMRYLQLNERQSKTRTEENVNDIRDVSPKFYECVGERDPVALYEKFAPKRPSGMSNEMDPFYIAKRTIPLTGAENELWFIRQRLGSKSLASVMKVMKEKGNLDDNKRLTNHSAQKYLVQKLKHNNVQDTDIMQILGHKNVQSIRNYRALNEDKHKQISNVLSNTTGEPPQLLGLVPVVSNLPLTSGTTVNDDFSVGSDNSTICSQTNTSNRIDSMFYGAKLQIQSMNVHMCDRH
ncbi:Hypothetical predicted protein [Mytilus galloprovincialis]|uniref:ZMYM2-like/QRICH1 C-terminal domain-containing protein n=1 Tax=Mytilus galloprovincialis TaxID=29158 RepID=A0A8B6FS70_MYTGA|nr:Hypothetical predicted protein [Mytilus galloprovincialis]